VQNVIFLTVNGVNAEQAEAGISKEKTPFLEKHFNSPGKCLMRDTPFFSPDNERFWELFFSSKHSNDHGGLGSKKKIRKQKNEHSDQPLSYEETLLEKYTTNLLTKDELQMNLYPMDNLPIYEDYLKTSDYKPTKTQSIKDLILGVDCEMVRTCQGMELARLTVINFDYEVIYDEFIKPENPIDDYLTKYSGITVEHMNNATKGLKDAQQDFLKFCNADTFLVGHSLENDLQSLNIIHEKIIDTSVLYMNTKGYKSSLKNLSHHYLHIDIQKGSHDSAEDAKSALALAKFKIEILDNFESFVEKKKTAQLDILENIFSSQKTLLPLDESPFINPLLKYAIFYDEVKSRGFDEITAKILKWLRMKASGVSKPPSIMAGVIKAEENIIQEEAGGEDNSFLVRFDKKCQEIAEKCDKNTVFLIVFCDSKENSGAQKKTDEAQGSAGMKRPQSLGLFFVP